MTSIKPSNMQALAFRTQCVFENGIAEPGDDFRLEYLKRLKAQFPDEQIPAKAASPNPLPEEIKKICGQLIKNANTHFERSTFLAETIKLVPQNTPPQFRTIFNEIIDTSASQTRSLPSYYWRDLLSVRPDFEKNLRAHNQIEANSPEPILLKPTPCSNSVEWEKHELKIGHYRIPVFLPLEKTYPWAMFEEYLESGFVFLQAVLSPEEFFNLLSPGKNRPDLSLFIMSPITKAEEAFNHCGIRTDDRDGQYDPSRHAITLLFKQSTTFHSWSGKDTKGRPENFLQHFSAWPFEVFLHEMGHAYASVYFNQDAQFKTVMGRYFDWLWEQTIQDEKERGEVKSIVTSRSWDKEGRAKLEAAHTVPDYKIYLPESPLPDKTSPYALRTPSELLAQLFQEYFLTRINRLSPDLAEKKDAHFKARYRLMAAYFENPARLDKSVWSLKTIQQIFKDEGIELGFIKDEVSSAIGGNKKEKRVLSTSTDLSIKIKSSVGLNQWDTEDDFMTPYGGLEYTVGGELDIKYRWLSILLGLNFVRSETQNKEIPGGKKPTGPEKLDPFGNPISGGNINYVDRDMANMDRTGLGIDAGLRLYLLNGENFRLSVSPQFMVGLGVMRHGVAPLKEDLDGSQELGGYTIIEGKLEVGAEFRISESWALGASLFAYGGHMSVTGTRSNVPEGLADISSGGFVRGFGATLGFIYRFGGEDEREVAQEPRAPIIKALEERPGDSPPPASKKATGAPAASGAEVKKAPEKATAPGASGGAEKPAAGGPGTPSPLPEAVKATSGAGAAEVTPTGPTGTSTATKAAPQKGVPVVEDRRYGESEAPKVE